MAGIFKQYSAGTLDLISSDYTRPEENASDMKNVLFTGSVEDPAIEKRFGGKRRSTTGPMFGLVSFTRVNPTSQILEDEVLGFFEDRLKRRKSATLSVSYSGAAASVKLTIQYDPATSDFRCKIVEDGVTVLNNDLGLGYDEGSPVTLAALDTAISALSGYSASVSGTTTIPAAFVQNVFEHDLKAAGASLVAYEWEDVTVSALITGNVGYNNTTYKPMLAWSDQEDFENVSHVALNNCLYYYAAGTLWKYDGDQTYYAGMRKETIATHSTAGGSIAAGTYQYKLRFIHNDNAGNQIIGPWSDPYSVTLGGASQVTIDVPTTQYGYDDSAGSLQVELARTNLGGVQYYQVALQNYASTVVDNTATLSTEVDDPEFEFGPPPAGSVVGSYKGALVCSGFPYSSFNIRRRKGTATGTYDLGAANEVWFGDFENIEGFPTDGSYSIDVSSGEGDYVVGLVESGDSVLLFKRQSTARLTGDQTELNVAIEWMSKEVGCLAGHSIKEVNGQIFFLSNRGFAVVSESRSPDEKLGYTLRTILDQDDLSEAQKLRFRMGYTAIDAKAQRYMAFFPAFTSAGAATEMVTVWPNLGDGQTTQVSTSLLQENGNGWVYVFDYLRNRWSRWKMNAWGGLAVDPNDKVIWAERRYSSFSSDLVFGHFVASTGREKIMFQDHENDIPFLYSTAWYAQKKPSIPKQHTRLRVSSIPDDCAQGAVLTVVQQCNFLKEDRATLSLTLADAIDPYAVVAQSRMWDGKARSIRLVMQNEENNQNLQIEGWEIELDAPYIDELKT